MNKDQLNIMLSDWQEDQKATLQSKGHDYANKDLLSNFKKVALMTELPVTKVFEVMQAIKFVRIQNLLEKGDPKNESVKDSLKDFSNYVFLEACYLDLAGTLASNKDG